MAAGEGATVAGVTNATGADEAGTAADKAREGACAATTAPTGADAEADSGPTARSDSMTDAGSRV